MSSNDLSAEIGSAALGEVTNDRAREKRRLERRSFVSDMPDKGLFIVTAMFGFATVFAAKILWPQPYLVAAWAVSIMVLYGVVAYRIPLVRLRVDRLGDNFYYLGFIFTLASLSAALVQLEGSATDFQDLLGSFGIALVTTVVGIALRVMFVQMRSEIDQVEAEVRRDLLDTSTELRQQLALTLRDFKVLQTSVQQMTSELVSESGELVKRQLETIAEAATRTIGGTSELVKTQIDGIGETAAVLSREISASFASQTEEAKANEQRSLDQTRQVQEGVARTVAAMDTLAKRMATIELPNERLNEQLNEISADVARTLSTVREAADKAASEIGRGRKWWWWFFLLR